LHGKEDQGQVRKNHAPENLAVMRRIALNLLRKEKTANRNIVSSSRVENHI
jgi:predicted transposase YbfD/YdcC